MKCTKTGCEKPAVAHDHEDELLCGEHLRIRCPEYIISCPHCDLEIAVN